MRANSSPAIHDNHEHSRDPQLKNVLDLAVCGPNVQEKPIGNRLYDTVSTSTAKYD